MAAVCRSCKEPVTWAFHASGSRAPFDVEPAETQEGEVRWVLAPDP